ncbi:MAG: DUF1569 domain-containing protein [Bryobacteraceae bacterium]
MSTFADPSVRTTVCARIERLTPDAQRRWGKMTPHQMICHLADGYRMSAAKRQPNPVDNLFTRTVMRFAALHTPLKWPRDIQTVPEADQGKNGTKPGAWEQDHAELIRMVDNFTPIAGHRHPIFGPLTETEWAVWAYRHADHHLRQFGM